ncbi:coenzyme Q-binding protein COQ10 homolog, mitochondrial-like isoform X2 [Salvelinus alpinus]|uniref:coenzyme Q-binding protein COQ10 homolog, mitochondrial-like isoform X2 n=1 Tax=Salvelinus alpinus TaxID=8036 RepID=UPI0039FD0A51
MAIKTTPLLFRALVEMSEVHSSKVIRGNPNRTNIRHLGSCGALSARRATLLLSSPLLRTTPSRSFINLAASITARRMEYSESRTLGYTPEQMYSVVASVDQYQHFVPWCKKSRVVKGRNGDVRAQLEIGFPPIVERYTSQVTVVPNHQVRVPLNTMAHSRVYRRIPLQPPGDDMEVCTCSRGPTRLLQHRLPRILRVQVPAALPAGHPVL